MIQVIFAGKEGFHDLADHTDGRIAGIIVDILQTDIDRFLVTVRKKIYIQSLASEGRDQQIKVKRRHVRRQDRIMIVLHLFRVDDTVMGTAVKVTFDMVLLTKSDGSDQRPDSYSCRSKVADLVDLQTGIESA